MIKNNQQSNLQSVTWYIIVNPKAKLGKGKVAWETQIKPSLEAANIHYVVAFTEARGHAMILVQAAIAAGYRYIIAAGGDGCNHEVINGIMQQTIVPSTDIIYTLIPIGTGNDWARQYHISTNVQRCVAQLSTLRIHNQDIALVRYQDAQQQTQERYSCNLTGLVYDAFVVNYIEPNKHKITNRFLYMWWLMRCLFYFKNPKVNIRWDGGQLETYLYTINVGICKYAGGGMQLAPHAIPDDGLLALLIAKKLPKWVVIILTPLIYTGHLHWVKGVSIYQTREVWIEAADDTPVGVEAEGEILGTCPVYIKVLPNALRIAIP